MREKVSVKMQTVYYAVQYSKTTIYLLRTELSFLLFIPFFGGKHNCLHAKSGTNREKYFHHIIYKEKDADSGGK